MLNSVFEPRRDEIQNLVTAYYNDQTILDYQKQISKLFVMNTAPAPIMKGGLIIDWGFRWIDPAANEAHDNLKFDLQQYIQQHYSLILKNNGQ